MPMVENQHAARFTEVTSACCQQGFYSLSSSTFKISIQELSPFTTPGDNSTFTGSCPLFIIVLQKVSNDLIYHKRLSQEYVH